MKLKRNNHFDLHRKASLTRDLGSAFTADQRVQEYEQQLLENYRQHGPPALLRVIDDAGLESSFSDSELPRSDSGNLPHSGSRGRLDNIGTAQWSMRCEFVKNAGERPAVFHVHANAITIAVESIPKVYAIPLTRIEYIFQRRRFHHPTAIEIFCIDGRVFFLNFPGYRSQTLAHRLSRLPMPNLRAIQLTPDPAKYFRELGFTEKWQRGELSNFDYLVRLNIFSGRSFIDQSQYPFFPWILKDYVSAKLDLTSPHTFRDLTRPIGALGKRRFEELKRRRDELEKFEGTRYLFSSYTICPLTLYVWLMRAEPFTTHHIQMQGGKFDHANRLFASVGDCWRYGKTHPNNYRELIPEFFFSWNF
jgi:hypothetical protein